MPQLSLYLNDRAMEVLRDEASREKCSVSGFVSQLIMDHAGKNGWPTDYWTEVYGALDDPSFSVPGEADASLDGTLPAFS